MSIYYNLDGKSSEVYIPTAAEALEISKNNKECVKKIDLKNIEKAIRKAMNEAKTNCIYYGDLYNSEYIKEILTEKEYKVEINFYYPAWSCKIDWSEND